MKVVKVVKEGRMKGEENLNLRRKFKFKKQRRADGGCLGSERR